MFVRIKWIKERPYLYLCSHITKNGKTKQKVIDYLGSATKRNRRIFKEDIRVLITNCVKQHLKKLTERLDTKQKEIDNLEKMIKRTWNEYIDLSNESISIRRAEGYTIGQRDFSKMSYRAFQDWKRFDNLQTDLLKDKRDLLYRVDLLKPFFD